MTTTQSDKAIRFKALHEGLGAFVIPTPWDAGSACILAGLGFQALATSSGASAGIFCRRHGSVMREEALAQAGGRRGINRHRCCPVIPAQAGIQRCRGRLLAAAEIETSARSLPCERRRPRFLPSIKPTMTGLSQRKRAPRLAGRG